MSHSFQWNFRNSLEIVTKSWYVNFAKTSKATNAYLFTGPSIRNKTVELLIRIKGPVKRCIKKYYLRELRWAYIELFFYIVIITGIFIIVSFVFVNITVITYHINITYHFILFLITDCCVSIFIVYIIPTFDYFLAFSVEAKKKWDTCVIYIIPAT